MNDRSSRSHSIFVVWMQRQEAVPAVAGSTISQRREISARINLVDLAGSERMAKSGAKGDTMKEGININQARAFSSLLFSSLLFSSLLFSSLLFSVFVCCCSLL